ncbi:MAG: acetolactate synthase small subunit [Bacillota bacterium]|nr:acetolactate synthase small subunit [Bacillota bacterium]
MEIISKHILSVLVENHSGVLSKITGLFTRRGYNIDSLTVGVTEDPGVSRITLVLNGDEYIVEQISKQLNKIVDVIKVVELSPEKCVCRELVMVKINNNPQNKDAILRAVDIFRGDIVDCDSKSMSIEITGDDGQVSSFIEFIRPFGIKEIIRTGLSALERGSDTITEL